MKKEEKDILIKVEGLSKKFCKDLKRSLLYGFKDLWSGMFQRKNIDIGLRENEFWALQDINFELRRGECLGLIGHNGAGKSTLLKILCGLINPDKGQVVITGRIGAMIELGAGFNPIMTGRENIYNNGAILGLSRLEIDSKLQEIIDFAELNDFIDMPVQNYSSGMKVRLGFAIAAQMEPDVLIIDEVLAVGDLGFTLKCFKTIDEILPKTALVFVSHNMPVVSRVCNKIMLMDRGEVKYHGEDVAKGIDKYYSRFNTNDTSVLIDEKLIELVDSKVISDRLSENQLPELVWNENLNVYFKFKIHKPLDFNPVFLLIILDKEQRPVALLQSNDHNSNITVLNNHIEFNVRHQYLELSKGIYTLDLIVQKTDKLNVILSIKNICSFQLTHEVDIYPPFLLASKFISKQ